MCQWTLLQDSNRQPLMPNSIRRRGMTIAKLPHRRGSQGRPTTSALRDVVSGDGLPRLHCVMRDVVSGASECISYARAIHVLRAETSCRGSFACCMTCACLILETFAYP